MYSLFNSTRSINCGYFDSIEKAKENIVEVSKRLEEKYGYIDTEDDEYYIYKIKINEIFLENKDIDNNRIVWVRYL